MLEILNNRTKNTHENEQFRRVVDIIEATFEKFGYNGLLLGNPFNESYSRFRADAILLYDHGLIIVDFKIRNAQRISIATMNILYFLFSILNFAITKNATTIFIAETTYPIVKICNSGRMIICFVSVILRTK